MMQHGHAFQWCAVWLLSTAAASAWAQALDQLDEVQVTGVRTPAAAPLSDKLGDDAREIPNSLSVISEQRIEDQNLTTVDQALAQVTGVYVLPQNSQSSQYHARGYTLALMNDGVPAFNSLVSYPQFDLVVYERLEVLKGPIGILQGTSAPGGSVNLVSKHPHDSFAADASVTAGSWENGRGTLDVTGPLTSDGSIRARAAIAYQGGNSFTDETRDRRGVAYGVLEWDVLPDTTLSSTVVWENDQVRATYIGIPLNAATGQLLDLPRNTNPVPAFSRESARTVSYRFGLAQKLSEHLNLTATAIRTDQDAPFDDGYPVAGLDVIDGTIPVGRRNYDVFDRRKALDVELTSRWTLWGQFQQLLLGYNYDGYSSQISDVNETAARVAIVVPFEAVAGVPNIALPFDQGTRTETAQEGGYAQARLKPIEPLTLLLGGRLSSYDTRSRTTEPGAPTPWHYGSAADHQWIPYAGTVYDLTSIMSVYGSYSTIYVPQSTLLRADGTPLDARTGVQYEVGLKSSSYQGRLRGSLAGFLIHDHNEAISDAANPGFYSEAGLSESKGWEAEITGQVLPTVSLEAGYTRLNLEYLDASAALIGQNFDEREPKHSWRVWAVDTLPVFRSGTVKIGLGFTGQSTTYDYPAPTQGGYTIFNALLAYRVTGRYEIALNGSNILDKSYFARLGNLNTYNTYGPPANFSVTVRAEL